MSSSNATPPNLPTDRPYRAHDVTNYHDAALDYLTTYGTTNLSDQSIYTVALRGVRVLAGADLRQPLDRHTKPDYSQLVGRLLGILVERGQIESDDADAVTALVEDADEAMSSYARRVADPAGEAAEILGAYADG